MPQNQLDKLKLTRYFKTKTKEKKSYSTAEEKLFFPPTQNNKLQSDC
jgi:hypothetical protein